MRKRPSDPEQLTTSEAAALLQVSVATLKRWTEAGLLGPERTKGGHRRFSSAALQAFSQRPKSASERGAGLADDFLESQDPVEIQAILLRTRKATSTWAEASDVLRPAFLEVDRRRREAHLTTVQWLRFFERLQQAIDRMATCAVVPRNARRLLVLCTPGDRLRYVGLLAGLVAQEAGFICDMVGAVWPHELGLELDRILPTAILATASADADPRVLDRIRPEIVALAKKHGLSLGLLHPGYEGGRAGASVLGSFGELLFFLTSLGIPGRTVSGSPGLALHHRLEWDSSLSLGDEMLDAQHQLLFRMVSGFIEAAAENAAPELAHLLQFVEDYTEVHFRFEESFMRTISFPDLGEHIFEHESFVRRLHSEKPIALSGAPEAALGLANLLRDWLVQHVGGSDQRIGAFLRTRGRF